MSEQNALDVLLHRWSRQQPLEILGGVGAGVVGKRAVEKAQHHPESVLRVARLDEAPLDLVQRDVFEEDQIAAFAELRELSVQNLLVGLGMPECMPGVVAGVISSASLATQTFARSSHGARKPTAEAGASLILISFFSMNTAVFSSKTEARCAIIGVRSVIWHAP